MNSCSGGLSGMDFGMLNLVGSAGAENGGTSKGFSDSQTSNPKSYGSGFLKQERSVSGERKERGSKMARIDDFPAPKTMLCQQAAPLLRSNPELSGDDGQHILSFSSTKTEVPFLSANSGERTAQSAVLPFFQQASTYSRTAGYASGGLNAEMHGPFARFRGPFTLPQWMELEHQALIYKHIVANAPVPPNLLIPLKKSLNPYAFSGLSSGSDTPNSLGWGSFHHGFSGNADPEPGRCRRTDGKKWRCSRDAVPDQKYCERHINRGRHRSRKPVEGQTGHAVSGSTTSRVQPIALPLSASVMSSSGTSNSLGVIQHQFKNFQAGASFATDALMSRKEDSQGLISSTVNSKLKATLSSTQKQHYPFEESSQSKFGLVSSASLPSPSPRSSFMDSKSCNFFLNPNDQEMHDQHPLLHFIDDWPKNQSDRVTVSWPEELKSDWTELSMSIPVSSNSNSLRQDKLNLSPLRVSHEFDPIQMGLGVCNDPSELIQKQANWIPISWGNSVGGPLGEVLSSTSNTVGASKNSSALNLVTEACNCSPQFGSSPTGVLQKATFVSLSNSSSGSSPRADKKVAEGASIFNDVGGSLASSSSIPSF